MMHGFGMKRAAFGQNSSSAREFRAGKTVTLLACVALLCASAFAPAKAQTPPEEQNAGSGTASYPFAADIEDAARRFDIPALWLRAVMQVESAGNAQAVSPKGAIGLMQIMPQTYAELRQDYDLGADPFDPHDNILAGAAYLHEMYDRYGTPGFLAAYNAGPARYDEHVATGEPLPEETQIYLSRLEPLIDGVQVAGITTAPDLLSWMNAPLFIGGSSNDEINPIPRTTKVSFEVANGRPAGTFITPKNANDGPLTPQSAGMFVPVTLGARRNE